jgi:hypothetical protein
MMQPIPFSIMTADGSATPGGDLTITEGDPTGPGWVGAVTNSDPPTAPGEADDVKPSIWLRLDDGPFNGHVAEALFTDASTLEGLTGFTTPTVDSPRA